MIPRQKFSKKTLLHFVVLFATLVLSSISALAQGSAGRIVGAITDASGGAITGATVTVTDVDRGVNRTLTTDATGAFAAPNLTPGNYRVRAEYKGFKTVDRQNIQLEVAQELRVDLAMQPGDQTQVVNVTESVPLIETTNAELGGTMQNQVINDLPLNGRNFGNLLDLRPGVITYPGHSGWTQSTNGLRPHDNFYMVDGINSNDPWMAQSMMNAVMAAGDAGTILPIDAIDEFKTQQNPRAEYGWKPGAVVNVGIKSGGNAYHGSAYAYGRSDAMDAAGYFDQGQKAPLNLEQYGGSVGGRIIKDKLFFFGNYESQYYSVGNTVEHVTPITAAGVGSASQNIFGACLAAKASSTGLSSLSAQMAGLSTNCTALTNAPGLFPANSSPNATIFTSLSTENRVFSGVGKLDYHLSEKDSFNGMFFISPGTGTFVDNPGLQVAQQWLTNQSARSMVGSGNWIRIISPTVVNSFRAGYSHYYQAFLSNDSTQNPTSYSYNGATYNINTGQTNSAYYGLPLINFQGGYNFQLGLNWPKSVGPDAVYQFSDSVSVLKGNHSLKFGGEFLINQSTNNVTANTKGNFRFSNLTSFFQGNFNRARFTSGDAYRQLQDKGFAMFAQDDWRVTPRFTINAGIRYELTTVPTEANNLVGNFTPGVGMQQVGNGLSSLYQGDHNNIAPRLGFAWDIAGNGKTVIRGSAGIYYEQGSFDAMMALGNLLGLRTVPTGVKLYSNGSQTSTTAGGTINVQQLQFTGGALGSTTTVGSPKYGWFNNGPNTPIFSASPACGDGTVKLATGFTPQPCTLLGVDQGLRTPYVTTWNFGIQRAVTNNLSLEVTYVGNHATKLMGLSNLNAPTLGSGWGSASNPASPLGQCLASAGTGYDNCAPDSGLQNASRPYGKQFPFLSDIYWLSNSNISNYNGLQVSATQRTQHGLSFVIGYSYSHALAESSDNWSFQMPVSNNQRSLYSSTLFDVRHRFTASATYMIPGLKTPGKILQGWSLNTIFTVQTGAPWGVNDTSTDFSGTNMNALNNSNGEQWNFYGNPSDFKTTKDIINAGGITYHDGTSFAPCLAQARAIGQAAVASLTNLGCYSQGSSILIPPAFGSYGSMGNNLFRGPGFTNVDFSVTKQITWGAEDRYKAQFRAEFFNVFNHPNISNPYGGPGGDNTYTDPTAQGGGTFGFRPETPDITSSNPILGSGGPRAIQLGLKIIF